MRLAGPAPVPRGPSQSAHLLDWLCSPAVSARWLWIAVLAAAAAADRVSSVIQCFNTSQCILRLLQAVVAVVLFLVTPTRKNAGRANCLFRYWLVPAWHGCAFIYHVSHVALSRTRQLLRSAHIVSARPGSVSAILCHVCHGGFSKVPWLSAQTSSQWEWPELRVTGFPQFL
jgi:hypothetical protein